MTISEFIAKTDSFLRPGFSFLNPKLSIKLYSYFRKLFLEQLVMESNFNYKIPSSNSVKLWDIKFQSPIFNAAGMFKNGKGYYTVANQGAGAFLAGTATENFRSGNLKLGIKHPFAPYPHSFLASNWMGLPNDGHIDIAKKLSEIKKIDGCPIGISLSSSPEDHGLKAVNGLLKGLIAFEKAGVDFIEINESCPNVEHDSEYGENGLDKNLIERIEFINNSFIKKLNRNLPVIIKLSNDTSISQIEPMIDLLIDNNFSGVNFGNTSINYENVNNYVHSDDWNLYKYFITNFGGGISGFPLKKTSLDLCSHSINILREKQTKREFNVIRTGGIFDRRDIDISNNNGIKLNQWYTGYFEGFSKFGHSIYEEMFNK